jgi:hypothetical protein
MTGHSQAQTQTRGHAGHSHHHAHDNAYLVSTNKNDAGVRITRIGLYVNLGMAVGKGFGGYVFNSQGKCLSVSARVTLSDSAKRSLPTLSTALQILLATS